MKNTIKFFALLLAITFTTSCSESEDFSNHPLVGNYLGGWDNMQNPMNPMTIEPNEENTGLVLLFSPFDEHILNVTSDDAFTIDEFEYNQASNSISGILIGDTLNMFNTTYLVFDKENTMEVRTGKFAKQE